MRNGGSHIKKRKKKAMSENKRTRSFRCSDSLWQFVEQTAGDQSKKPTEVVIEALAAHCGELIRKDRQLTAQQVTSLLTKLDRMESELASVRKVVGKAEHEPTNENTS